MAGIFTGLRYDNDAYREQVRRSTYPLNYRMDPNSVMSCNTCFAPYASFTEQKPTPGQIIDVDSILKGIDNKNSRGNTIQPSQFPTTEKLIPLRDCSNALETEYTRYTNPSYDIKGLTTSDMRFGYPLYDPQCNIFQNFEVNTRLQAKDNYKAVWQVPFDQRSALPQEKISQKRCSVSYNCK